MKEMFDRILHRKNNGSMKWETEYIKKRFQLELTDHDDFYPLFIADMDFELCPEVLEKFHQYYKNPDFGYFHIQSSFFESIVNWYKDIHHITINKDWIIPSIGTITSLHLVCDMLARNREVLYFTPIYGPFQNCANLGKKKSLPLLLKDNKYQIDFEKLEELFKTHGIKVLLFCNPHNPGGRMWKRGELQKLVSLCQQYHVTILSDEIHGDFEICDERFVSLIEFHDQYDQIIVSSSPNKTFNISGLSTSYLICANPKIIQEYGAYFNQLHLGCNRMGIWMVEAVYNYGKEWYYQLLEYLKENIQSAVDIMQKNDIQVMRPECGYLIWIHVSKVKNIDRFIIELAKETHVLLETGSRFVDNYEGWIRINVATRKDIVETAIKKFVKFYSEYEEKDGE